MYQQKIGICFARYYDIPLKEELKMIKDVGFDAVSLSWRAEAELRESADVANALGLELQSLHAPFGNAANLWSEDEDTREVAQNEILAVVDVCASLQIPIAVVHVWIGFDYTFEKERLNYKSFDTIVRYAKEKQVRIAFENTEGIEYLYALMEHFKDNDTVGFCWDSGHEMCYNYSEDLLGAFGERLLMTHLNDNLGISRFDGKIFWTDDLHLLPFDGIGDWDDKVARLKKACHQPILNFELSIVSKPDRHENDVYAKMTPVEYYTEAYKRACRIAYAYSR
jgi:sugar phosphate isomerase/epimerase